MTARCRHIDFGLALCSGPLGSKYLPDAQWCGRPADPVSDPNDPRCTEHLNEEK